MAVVLVDIQVRTKAEMHKRVIELHDSIEVGQHLFLFIVCHVLRKLNLPWLALI